MTPSHVQQTRCPDCETALMNVQGVDICGSCGWMTDR